MGVVALKEIVDFSITNHFDAVSVKFKDAVNVVLVQYPDKVFLLVPIETDRFANN